VDFYFNTTHNFHSKIKPRNIKMDKKTILIVVLAVIVAVGGYMYYQNQQSNTVSLSVGGKEISAQVN